MPLYILHLQILLEEKRIELLNNIINDDLKRQYSSYIEDGVANILGKILSHNSYPNYNFYFNNFEYDNIGNLKIEFTSDEIIKESNFHKGEYQLFDFCINSDRIFFECKFVNLDCDCDCDYEY